MEQQLEECGSIRGGGGGGSASASGGGSSREQAREKGCRNRL